MRQGLGQPRGVCRHPGRDGGICPMRNEWKEGSEGTSRQLEQLTLYGQHTQKNQNKKHPSLGEIPTPLSCETTGHGNPPVSQANGELWYRRRRTLSWLTQGISGLAKTYNNKWRLRACTCTHVLVPGTVQGLCPGGHQLSVAENRAGKVCGQWMVGPGDVPKAKSPHCSPGECKWSPNWCPPQQQKAWAAPKPTTASPKGPGCSYEQDCLGTRGQRSLSV